MSEWVEYMTFDGESPMANLRKENGKDERGHLNILVLEMKTGVVEVICVHNTMQIFTVVFKPM